MNKEKFYGYIYNENGLHGDAKLLNGTIELNAFVEQHADSAPRIIVTDALDRCVLESRDGEVVFPRPDQEARLKPMLRVLIVEPHLPPREAVIENNLEAMQKTVGGLVEFVSMGGDNDVLLICNEEGKLMGLDGNRRVGEDIIAGTFFLCADGGEKLASLSKEQISEYTARFQEDETFMPEEVESSMKLEFYPL